jgi:hypothetical protein
MGMPAFVYRWGFRAHSLKSRERNILGCCGIGPIKESLVSNGRLDSLFCRPWRAVLRQGR